MTTLFRHAALLGLLPGLLLGANAQVGTSAQAQTASSPVAPAAPSPAPTRAPVGSGVRGLWVDAFGPGLKTRAQAQATVDEAARMGVNTLFVQAIRRGDCLCLKSAFPPVTDRDLEKGFDPLGFITDAAHARGIKVIAWASVTGIANTATPNTDPRHVMKMHGPQSKDSWMARRQDGTWQEGNDGWLDAGIPAAADYVVAGMRSLVKNYPVDGVQLDRIRYPDGGNWGYDPKVLARYRAETGQKGTPAGNDGTWQEWKRHQVTALVRRIALEVKTLRPDVWLSAATIAYTRPPAPGDLAAFRRTRTYTEVFQDWPTWVREGLIELNVPMNYKRDGVNDQSAWFDGWNAFAGSMRARRDGLSSGVASGTAMYLNAPAVTASQATRSVKAGLGWVGYSYRTPTLNVYDSKETQAQGLEAVRVALAAPGGVLSAPQPWTEDAPSVRGLYGKINGTNIPGYQLVRASQNGKVVAETRTDGNGYYGFLALPPGKTEIRVSGQYWADTIPARGVVRLPNLFVREMKPVAVPIIKTPVAAPEPVNPTDNVPDAPGN